MHRVSFSYCFCRSWSSQVPQVTNGQNFFSSVYDKLQLCEMYRQIQIHSYVVITGTLPCYQFAVQTRTTRTPSPSWLPIPLSHIGSQVKRRQSQSYKFNEFAKISTFKFCNNHYTRHTFGSCLIRCANMKWIQWVLLKIQSWHDSVHRRTGRQTDKVKPVYPLFNFVESEGTMLGYN